MQRTNAGLLIVLSMLLSLSSTAGEKAHYYAAEDLADDCVSRDFERKNECFGVMQGVLGTLGFLNTVHSPFANVLCLPPMSPATVKDAFLSAFYADRHGLTGMLAGAAVASVLYDRYPCPAERNRREEEGKRAAEELKNLVK